MSLEIKQSLRELQGAHDSFLAAAAGVKPARRSQDGACGHWSPQAILAHLAGWDEALSTFIANPEAFVPPDDIDQFNERSVAIRRDHSWPEAMADLESEFARLLMEAAAVTPEMKIFPRVISWLGGRRADYDLHAEQLRIWNRQP